MVEIKLGTIDQALAVEAKIPEFDGVKTQQQYQERLKDKGLILIAFEKNQAVGYKVGYGVNQKTFYSWLGGVVPKYRKQGVAQALLEAQENYLVELGYQNVAVKTMNQFPAMLCFLIRNQYQIAALSSDFTVDGGKIHFIKRLKKPSI